jgi:integrase
MNREPAAATTVARKRAVFYGALNYAVELDILPANPIDKVKWKAPEIAEEIDRSVVARPRLIRELLEVVEKTRPNLTAFFGCLYYAYMRPGEAKLLRRRDCTNLPERGWGLLLLTSNAPRVGAKWTDSGSSHEERQLKHRAKKITRPVPIPPELVRLLRNHLERYGVTPDGRLFRGERGGPLSETVYGRVWQATRQQTLTDLQAMSALVGRPYDLRHSGVTLALNAGVPAPEVARRAGHSVEVLLRVYAGCIDGHEKLWNDRIADALRDDEGATQAA